MNVNKISPNKHNLGNVFSSTSGPYYIDFYQREYKWRADVVEKLLSDVFLKFDNEFKKNVENTKIDFSIEDLDKINNVITKNFSWYYLNTYIVTQSEDNETIKSYIVDGQQRLTTCFLILIALCNISTNDKKFKNEGVERFLRNLIGSSNISGSYNYRIKHKDSENILNKIMGVNNNLITNNNESTTIKTIENNYNIIKEYLDNKIKDKSKEYVYAFCYYFINNIILVCLELENNDVPMVFEVINDRGQELEKHDILKGKLLSTINKADIDKYLEYWNNSINIFNDVAKLNSKSIDWLFATILRGRYATNRAQARDSQASGLVVANNYHNEIFNIKAITSDNLNIKTIEGVKKFLEQNLQFYAKVAKEINNTLSNKKSYICSFHDEIFYTIAFSFISEDTADDKIKTKLECLTEELDKFGMTIRLQDRYDSHNFSTYLIDLALRVRDLSIDDNENLGNIISTYFNDLEEKSITNVVNYNDFYSIKQDSIDKTFTKYFFAKIEEHVSNNTEITTENFQTLTKGRGKNSYDIEHCLANNDENIKKFGENFSTIRNKYGAILLLKSSHNRSSSNNSYKDKLKDYAGTLLWNQTLTEDFYSSKPKNSQLARDYGLRSISDLNEDTIRERQRILLKMAKDIWGIQINE